VRELANPRWERRFLKFLELSGVGRAMAGETDEDGTRAARLDEWCGKQRRGMGGEFGYLFLVFSL